MGAVELVVFDIDDTLVGTAAAVAVARIEAIRVLAGTASFDIASALPVWRRLSYYFHDADRALLLAAIEFELFNEVSAAVVEAANDTYHRCFWQEFTATPGAQALLSELMVKGVQVGIVSNGTYARQIEKLRRTEIFQYFATNAIIVADQHSPLAKPRPDGLFSLAHSMGVSVEAAVYVGDRRVDTISAHLAGYAAAIQYDGRSIESHEPGEAQTEIEAPDFEIVELREVSEIITQLAGATREPRIPWEEVCNVHTSRDVTVQADRDD